MTKGMFGRYLAIGCAMGITLTAQATTIVRTGRTNPLDPATAGEVTTDEHWTNDNVYELNGIIFVHEGATLTIDPGTLIRKRGATGAGGRPGALIVTRGAKIRALGTKEQPIVMTNLEDNHFVGPNPVPGTAPWSTPNNGITETCGGLIVMGRTYIADTASTPNSGNTKQVEGIEPFGDLSRYGGGDDDDDSGVIRHVSLRYGGWVIGDANEINGITLCAVGRGTTIEHVEVFQNKDDGIEFFGGTVNTKYMINWVNGDDGFDWDEGFRGKGQFWLNVQGPLLSENDKSDKGVEMDGATGGDGSQPSSIGTVYNATMVGLGRTTGLKNAALHFRDGTGGRYYNSMFLDFGGPIALIEGNPADSSHNSGKMTTYDYAHVKPGTTGGPTGNTGSALAGYIGYDHELGGKMLEIKNCVFWSFGYPNAYGNVANSTGVAGAYGAEDNRANRTDGDKFHLGLDTGYDLFDVAFNNTYLSHTLPAPVMAFVRGAAVNIGGTDYFPIEALNANLPAGSPYLTGGKALPDDGFYTAVDFRGAFDDTANWASWTVIAKKGLLEIEPTTLKTDYDQPFIQAEHLTYTVRFSADESSLTYKVWHTETLSPANWVEI
ncbi:MAG: hypothetical protein U1E27_13505, partial [Kiritimatiellia bacterium]|nr:hypothetical protein [Kiritimatiellia bacterium]